MSTATNDPSPEPRQLNRAREAAWLPTRATLLERLRNWDAHESWREFFELYWGLIYGVCRRYGLPEEDARDVTQETIIAVAEQMPSFHYDRRRGAFKTWLFHVTRNKIVDHVRKVGRRPVLVAAEEAAGDADALWEKGDSAASGGSAHLWDEEWQRNLLELATTRVKAKIRPRQYQIFDLAVLQSWSTAEVMKSLGVSRTQVYVVKHRVAKRIKVEVAKLAKQAEKV